LIEAAAIIAAHPALIAGEIVVPSNFGQDQQWGAILPLLSSKGITIGVQGPKYFASLLLQTRKR
jgi:hypothetical protein